MYQKCVIFKGLSIKTSAVRGSGFWPVRTFFGQGGGGSSDANTALFGAKNFGFFEIYDVSARTRGGEASEDIFRTRREKG